MKGLICMKCRCSKLHMAHCRTSSRKLERRGSFGYAWFRKVWARNTFKNFSFRKYTFEKYTLKIIFYTFRKCTSGKYYFFTEYTFFLSSMSVVYAMYIISNTQIKEYIALSKFLYCNKNKNTPSPRFLDFESTRGRTF